MVAAVSYHQRPGGHSIQHEREFEAEINGKASISHTAFKQVRSTHVAARQCSTTSTEPPKQPSRNAVEPSGAVRLVEALCYTCVAVVVTSTHVMVCI